jgi:hypothetical protein
MGAGRIDETEAVSVEACALFPDDPGAWTLYARAATAAHNWQEAAKRWEAARKRFPEHPELIEHAKEVAYLAQSEMLGQDLHLDQSSTAETTFSGSEVPASKLLMNFENLGDNCELGYVQRFHGCEPLGLLRFSSMPYDLLMSALENRFDGVGDPENTILQTNPKNGHIFVSNTRYDMTAHTFIFEKEKAIDRQKFLQQQCRRLTYLRQKLITDLENCEKILVFRRMEFLSDDDIWALFRQLETYGPNSLLCVRFHTDAARDGRVEQLHDRLWVGYVKTVPPTDIGWNANQPSWLNVCRQVYASWPKKETALIAGNASH